MFHHFSLEYFSFLRIQYYFQKSAIEFLQNLFLKNFNEILEKIQLCLIKFLKTFNSFFSNLLKLSSTNFTFRQLNGNFY